MDDVTIGLTFGCFDLFHFGHLNYLVRCKKQCNKLIVAVYDDKMAKDIKGEGRPVYSVRERKLIVDALKYVHQTCIITNLDDLYSLSIMFGVRKIFKSEISPDINLITEEYKMSTEIVMIYTIPGLPRTTDIIQTVRNQFGIETPKTGTTTSIEINTSKF